MFEVFTNTSQTLAQNTAITFDTTKFSDCRVALNSAGKQITIKTPGRYLIHFDAVGGSTTASTPFTIQLYVNGIACPCAITTNTVGTANDLSTLGFDTLVQINQSCCCTNNSQTFQFIATNAISGIVSHANVSIIRL